MSQVSFIKSKINEVQYFINYFTDHIAEYRLSELTNSNCGDIPSIQVMHPLSLEYGNLLSADEQGNYTSALPAIGIELINDGEFSQQFLGSAQSQIEITEATIIAWEAMTEKQRIDAGLTLSTDNLANIRTLFNAKKIAGLKLFAKQYHYLQAQTINISIWSYHFDITRVVYNVVRGLLKRAKHDVSLLGVKNMSINASTNLYNYEFDRTLFGCEIEASFINEHVDLIVDSSTLAIADIKEFVETNDVDEKATFNTIHK